MMGRRDEAGSGDLVPRLLFAAYRDDVPVYDTPSATGLAVSTLKQFCSFEGMQTKGPGSVVRVEPRLPSVPSDARARATAPTSKPTWPFASEHSRLPSSGSKTGRNFYIKQDAVGLLTDTALALTPSSQLRAGGAGGAGGG